MVMISTKGRYALRIMIDLAENGGESRYISMKSIAERQGISLKYLEKILPCLVSEKLIEGVRGKSGGYCLTKEPRDYTVLEILRIAEGDIAPVACLECSAEPCSHSGECRTLPMWKELDKRINDYLISVSLADLMKK